MKFSTCHIMCKDNCSQKTSINNKKQTFILVLMLKLLGCDEHQWGQIKFSFSSEEKFYTKSWFWIKIKNLKLYMVCVGWGILTLYLYIWDTKPKSFKHTKQIFVQIKNECMYAGYSNKQTKKKSADG